jgi:hypothetical protein
MLSTLDPEECFLTSTTDKPEVAAESKAKMTPIIPFHCHVKNGSIKTNPLTQNQNAD